MDRNKNLILVLDKNPVLKIQVNEKTTLGQILELANNFLTGRGIPVQNYTVTLKVDDKHYVPNYVLRDQNFMKSSIYKQIKSDQSLLIYDKTFTGISDIDMKILNELDDRSLMQTCLINKYIANLCNNDNLWRNRYIKRFGTQNLHYKDKKFQDVSWKYIYLLLISEFDFLESNVKNISEIVLLLNKVKWEVGKKYEDLKELNDKIKFYFGKLPFLKIGFEFQIGVDESHEGIEKDYKTDKYFTPHDIMNIIYDFYHSPLTIEEYQQNVQNDNPYTNNYNIEQVKEGKVYRYQMLPNLMFNGLWFMIPLNQEDINVVFTPDFE